jgi:hypothetical protein
MPKSKKISRSQRLRAARKQRPNKTGPWDVLTLLVVLATAAIGIIYLLIFTNPTASYNPFPPPTMPAALVIPTTTPAPPTEIPVSSPTSEAQPTETPTVEPVEPSPTAEQAPAVEDTATPVPTITHTPQTDIILITPIPEGNDPGLIFFTPTATLRVSYLYPYVLQSEPYAVQANTFVENRGCSWMGVAGQVFDLQNRPTTGVNIQLGGLLSNRPFPMIATITGSAPDYGLGGFEFKISDKPLPSSGTLWIRLVDQAGTPISARTHFDTPGTCETNLVLINFQQKR